jgi:predicted secreted protein
VASLSWQSIHLAAFREASRLHHELGIDITRVVDPFAALAALGVVVMRRPLERAAGIYLPRNDGPGVPPGVLINSRHPLAKQRFTAAHELGHHRRDAAAVFDSDTELLPRRDDRHAEVENLAETFAAWFLMPKPLVSTALAGLGVRAADLTPALAYRFALAVRVSYRAAVHHLGDLGLITGSHRRDLLRSTPGDVKAQLGAPAFLDTLRRDVWHVDIDHDRGPLLAVAGDVVAIDVAEAPSTGYLWSIKAPPGVSELGDEWLGDREGIGGKGLHRFWLRLDKAGHDAIGLEERRPWEAEITASRRLALATEARPESGISDPALLLEPVG